MGIEHVLQGDYEGAIADAGRSIAKGAELAGEQARKALQAIENSMKAEVGDPQQHGDTHHTEDQDQNYGAEQQRRKRPTPAGPATGR